MSLTVRELVSRSYLSLELLVEGDLDREIRWVHSSEMPDPLPYLRGGEVVLTAGIWFWHGTAAGAFAAGLRRADVAALGFGTNPLVREVPVELIDACRACDLTLFHVPDGVSFIEIAEEFVEVQHRMRERPLIDLLEGNGRFVECLQAGRGIDGVLRLLARLTGRQAAVLNRAREVIGSSGPFELSSDSAVGEPDVATNFEIPTSARDALLVVERTDVELTAQERATIDQAVAFLAIELQRARAVAESERRFAAELFDLVAAGAPQHAAVAARLQTFGIDAGRPLIVVCCESPAIDESLVAAQRWLDAGGLRGVFAVKAAELLGAIELSAATDPAANAATLHRVLGADAFVGVGGVTTAAHDLAASLTEARHACRFARRRRDVGYATHDALASHEFLLALQDEHVLRAFQDTLIRPLLEYDARRHTDLVGTIDTFLGSGGRYRETADVLHLHVNTLRLRLARIEQLTGRDLGSMEDRVDLWIALRTRPG